MQTLSFSLSCLMLSCWRTDFNCEIKTNVVFILHILLQWTSLFTAMVITETWMRRFLLEMWMREHGSWFRLHMSAWCKPSTQVSQTGHPLELLCVDGSLMTHHCTGHSSPCQALPPRHLNDLWVFVVIVEEDLGSLDEDGLNNYYHPLSHVIYLSLADWCGGMYG